MRRAAPLTYNVRRLRFLYVALLAISCFKHRACFGSAARLFVLCYGQLGFWACFSSGLGGFPGKHFPVVGYWGSRSSSTGGTFVTVNSAFGLFFHAVRVFPLSLKPSSLFLWGLGCWLLSPPSALPANLLTRRLTPLPSVAGRCAINPRSAG